MSTYSLKSGNTISFQCETITREQAIGNVRRLVKLGWLDYIDASRAYRKINAIYDRKDIGLEYKSVAVLELLS